jgi:fused signal recognition particle receptor
MAAEITKVLKPVAKPLQLDLSHKPHVILVVGVNGTGKTTTIGKLASKLSGAGLKVTVAAGDTFRAAAIEQLKIWADRTKSEFVGTKIGADAAGLAFDAFQQAKASKSDVLIIDTAGRLQNKTELMAELEKIVRVLGKLDPEAPHTVLQTLDATTGQNALNQVEIFRNIAGVDHDQARRYRARRHSRRHLGQAQAAGVFYRRRRGCRRPGTVRGRRFRPCDCRSRSMKRR